MTVAEEIAFFQNLSSISLKKTKQLIQEIIGRLKLLDDIGLNYLSLCRSSETISAGEARRIKLSTQLSSRLNGILYVLDEPSIGLHRRDNDKLLITMKRLRVRRNRWTTLSVMKAALCLSWIPLALGCSSGPETG